MTTNNATRLALLVMMIGLNVAPACNARATHKTKKNKTVKQAEELSRQERLEQRAHEWAKRKKERERREREIKKLEAQVKAREKKLKERQRKIAAKHRKKQEEIEQAKREAQEHEQRRQEALEHLIQWQLDREDGKVIVSETRVDNQDKLGQQELRMLMEALHNIKE